MLLFLEEFHMKNWNVLVHFYSYVKVRLEFNKKKWRSSEIVFQMGTQKALFGSELKNSRMRLDIFIKWQFLRNKTEIR